MLYCIYLEKQGKVQGSNLIALVFTDADLVLYDDGYNHHNDYIALPVSSINVLAIFS